MSDEKLNGWTNKDWVKKLKQQAEHSREYRHKLYDKVDLKNKKRILDVGCGTGAITYDIAQLTNGEIIGIDIDKEKFKSAHQLLAGSSNVTLQIADAMDLPFDDESFDLVVFCIVLIHIKDQQRAMNEMARVTKKNGIVLATLEPDYLGTMEYPETEHRRLFLKTVQGLGADLNTGRKMKVLFSKAGLITEVGMDTESEFILLKDDKKRLDGYLKNFWVVEKIFKMEGWTSEQIEKYKQEQVELIKSGLNFYFQPCFYAIGRKPTAP